MLNKNFIDKVARYIARNALLSNGGKYLVALSGGADSVCLTLAMKQLGYDIEAAHCNFHLRGQESVRDENFCRGFCAANGIPLHVTHFDTLGFARLRKMSVEMAARHLRYAYFDGLTADIGAQAVCVAHHLDDSVETVLLNLIRGTGIHGLTGIKAANGNVRRPLLGVTRHDIVNALNEAGQDYVTDSTNLVDDVVRNKIRLDILPIMRAINPSVGQAIAKTAERAACAARALDDAVQRAIRRIAVSGDDGTTIIMTDRLTAEAAPEYTLFTLLRQRSFTPAQTELIYDNIKAAPGRVFTSATHQLLIDRNRIIIEPLAALPRPLAMPEAGTYVLNNGYRLRIELIARDNGFTIPRQRHVCCADAALAAFPLTVRPAAPGDRFTPFGMNGSRLVSDFLTDRKLTLFEKRRQLVVTDASGRIIWIVDQRPDNRFRISEGTDTVLKITYRKE